MMSGEEGSYSSRMSNKSEKNMADFDGEESGCEDELVQLAAQVHYFLLSKFLSGSFSLFKALVMSLNCGLVKHP